MSSNSIAIMPKPTCETWFMEGALKPNYHYIEVKPDLSDMEEKMDDYTSHPDEAQAIIDHAHEYVEQFKDKKREEIISLLVLDKYFKRFAFSFIWWYSVGVKVLSLSFSSCGSLMAKPAPSFSMMEATAASCQMITGKAERR